MYRSDSPNRPKPSDLPADYQPRVVVKFRETQQPFGRFGNRAEAVAQLLPEVIEPGQPADAREPAIRFDLEPLARHIRSRKIGGPG